MAAALTPVINSLNAPFWNAAKLGDLALPFCVRTGRSFWPPSPFSPFATAGSVGWRPVVPEALLIARVIYRRSFLKAFDPLMPYAIGLVELAEGPRLQAFIRDPESAASPMAGDRVRLCFERPLGEFPILTAVQL
jgi:uncharacterized OB-fold protein